MIKILSCFSLLVVSCLFFLSCSSSPTDLVGKWDLDYAKKNAGIDLTKEDHPMFDEEKVKLKDGQMILNADSTFFLVCGFQQDVFYGTWSYSNGNINLYPQGQNITNIQLSNVKRKGNIITTDFLGTSKDQPSGLNFFNEFQFVKKDKDFQNSEFKSYATIEKNSWRAKATQKESEASMRNRIRAALDFTLTYLYYSKNVESSSVGVDLLKDIPLNFARNGLSLDVDNDRWNYFFYDSEDATLSYDILKKAFDDLRGLDIPEEYKSKPLDLNLYIIENLKNKV